MTSFKLNSEQMSVSADPDTPLLWVLRDVLNAKGTKFGCGAGLCGACTIHMDGKPVRSCTVPLRAAQDRNIVTIEGLSSNVGRHVQKAWQDQSVAQCGYCQSGMIMAATALLESNASPNAETVALEITNICRCGTYGRVKQAIGIAAENLAKDLSGEAQS